MIESAVPRSGCSMIRPTTPPRTIRDRNEREPQVVDPIHAPLENRRDEEDDGDLRELRRLPADPRDAEPPAGAVDPPAEEHADQGEDDQPQRRPDHQRLPVVAVVHLHQQRHQRQPEEGEGRLLPEEIRRTLAVLLEPDDGGRAVDHDQARAHQYQGGREQQLVRFEFPCHSDLKFRPSEPDKYSGFEPSSVRSRGKTPTSQTGAACVPSGQLFSASTGLMTTRLLSAPASRSIPQRDA